MRIVCQQTILMKYCLICYFWKSCKIWNCRLLQIIGGALKVKLLNLSQSVAWIIWARTCDFQQSGILTSVDSDQPVQLLFKLRNSKWCSVSRLTVIKLFKRLAKALIRLRVCAGWSEPLPVAHTTLLENSCLGLYLWRNWLVSGPYIVTRGITSYINPTFEAFFTFMPSLPSWN